MRLIVCCFINILLSVTVSGQIEENVTQPFRITFDEYVIYANHTISYSPRSKGHLGCGAGVYHSSFFSNQWHYMYGVEYNYIFLEDTVREGNVSSSKEYNEKFRIHTISFLPMSFRFSVGKNVKYFLESGQYFGFSFSKDNIGLNCGPSFGMGMRIPMKGVEWVIKADYKAGLQIISGYGFYQYCRFGIGIRKR